MEKMVAAVENGRCHRWTPHYQQLSASESLKTPCMSRVSQLQAKNCVNEDHNNILSKKAHLKSVIILFLTHNKRILTYLKKYIIFSTIKFMAHIAL